MADSNARRIYIGERYRGKAPTVERAAVIRQHVKGRCDVFTRGQRAEASEFVSDI
jgi:hypothetical protein